MPPIKVKLIEDVFTPEQKAQMIEKLTEAMMAIEGENMRAVTWVFIEDLKQGDWGIGGKAPRASDLQRMQRGVAA